MRGHLYATLINLVKELMAAERPTELEKVLAWEALTTAEPQSHQLSGDPTH